MGIVLFEFDLMLRDGIAGGVEDEEAGTGRSIVNGADEGFVSGLQYHVIKVSVLSHRHGAGSCSVIRTILEGCLGGALFERCFNC